MKICTYRSNFLQGKDLLKGLTANMYHVEVGTAICNNLSMTDSGITCRPPKNEPSDPYENKPRVRVSYYSTLKHAVLNISQRARENLTYK